MAKMTKVTWVGRVAGINQTRILNPDRPDIAWHSGNQYTVVMPTHDANVIKATSAADEFEFEELTENEAEKVKGQASPVPAPQATKE